MARFQDSIQRGTRALQPLATAVGIGTVYGITDEGNIQERSNGTVWQAFTPTAATTSRIIQIVNTETGAVATGTTAIPADDTIPQKTEGNEYMTLAVTPTSATNKLKIDVVFFATIDVISWITVALFQDTTDNALAVSAIFANSTPIGATISLSHYMTAGTTSATTFKVRAGRSGVTGTVTFNGASAARLFGGVAASSITITEILV